jgi:hypothetical protein
MAEDYMKVRRAKEMESRGTARRELKASGEKRMLKDNTQAGFVYGINTETEKYDMGRVRYDSVGMKGYAPQAFDYDY